MSDRRCLECGCRLSCYSDASDRYCWPCKPTIESGSPLPHKTPTITGQLAYQQRLTGLPWPDIAYNLGFEMANNSRISDYGTRAAHLARSYAQRAGLPWPPQRPVQ